MNRINFKLFGGAAVLAVAGSLMFTQMAMADKGYVKHYSPEKGFGFIKTDSGAEIYVHSGGLRDDIRAGDAVTFETKEGKKRLEAVNVKRMNLR